MVTARKSRTKRHLSRSQEFKRSGAWEAAGSYPGSRSGGGAEEVRRCGCRLREGLVEVDARGHVTDKLLTFHREHRTSPAVILRNLKYVVEQLRKSGQLEEGTKLQEAALKARQRRQKGPEEPGTLRVVLLARPGVAAKVDDVSRGRSLSKACRSDKS